MGQATRSDTVASSRRGRPPTHSAEEIRSACVAAGRDALRSFGLDLRLDGVTLEAAAAAAGISRAAAFRVWKDEESAGVGPQARFRQAVSTSVLSDFGETQDEIASAALVTLSAATGGTDLEEIAERVAAMPAPDRERLFAATVAAGTVANIASLAVNSLWHTRIGLIASVRSRDDADPALRDAVDRGDEDMSVRHVELFRVIFAMFGMRLRAGYRFEHLAVAAGCLAEGLALRRMSPFAAAVERPRPSHGGVDDDRRSGPGAVSWNLLGAASMGLINEFCEADPDATHATDPARC